ncbi:MAG: hypothetical protein AB7V08_13565 [Elusimicrobiales bacterium]
MDNQKYKKDSVFSSVFPQQEPASPPAPAAAPAHKPEVSEGQVSALNKKIEMLERSIVGELQRTLAERASAPPAPPPPPSPAIPAVISKITEMENRFKEFQEKFLMGAAQMKNIEESKISARREIEELLKVVREQQKYSELDRQMHDQLEKAWARVEQMEGRLVEAYAAAAQKPAPAAPPAVPPAPQVSAEEIAAAVLKAVDGAMGERIKAMDAKLDARLRLMEDMLRKSQAGAGDLSEAFRQLGASLSSQSARLDSALASISEVVGRSAVNAFAGKERLEDMAADMKAELKGFIKEQADRSVSAFVGHADASALDARERLDALARMIVAHVDSLTSAQAVVSARLGDIAAAVDNRAEEQRRASAASAEDAERSLRVGLDSLADRVRAENDGQLGKLREIFDLSASGQAALSGAAADISAVESRLEVLRTVLGRVLADLRAVNLEGILGVSGAVIRKTVEGLPGLCEELRRNETLMREKRAVIEAGALRLRAGGGGGANERP